MRARPDPRRLFPWFPLAAYLAALAARLVPVLLSRDLGIGLDDMFQYDMLGRSLAAGNGYRWYAPQDLQQLLTALRVYAGVDTSQVALPTDPRGILTSFRAPLYPAFLALIYRLNGLEGRFFAARLAQAFLTASLAPLAYALARRLGAAERPARLAALVPALWPLLVLFPLALATENLFIPLLAAGTLALFHAAETGRPRHAALAGLLLGLATLTRSVIVGFPLLAAALFYRWRLPRSALALVAVLAALTLPWSLRNTLLHGRLTFIETSLGYNLYLGYHPQGDGSFVFGPSLDLVTILDDAERDATGRRLAWGFIRQDPGRVPLLVLRKIGHLWGLEDRAFAYFYSNGLLGPLPSWAVVALFLVLVLPLPLVLPPALAGLVAGPRNRAWTLSLALLGWYVGIHALIMAEERFHLALVPLLAALAAGGLTAWPGLRQRLRGGDPAARRQALWIAALVGLALLNWGFELYLNAPRLAVLFGPQGWQAHFNY